MLLNSKPMQQPFAREFPLSFSVPNNILISSTLFQFFYNSFLIKPVWKAGTLLTGKCYKQIPGKREFEIAW